MLSYTLRYRLDLVAFVLVVLAGSVACWRIVRRRRPEEPMPCCLAIALAVLVLAGCGLAEWAGKQRRDWLVSILSGFAPTYGFGMQRLGHAAIGPNTAADDPVYLRMIEAQKQWLRLNPLIADVYTFRADPDGKIRILVDSETDYDHDGRINGECEARTKIGELYPEATPDFHAALRGETRFDVTLVPDRWGTFVSSLSPIYDDQGRIEAGVGIDYPADRWIAGMVAMRAIALAGTAAMIALLLTGATAGVLMRGEIQERKQAQEQLRRDKEAVDLVSRAKSEFIGVMTHEIRSPLTALMGYTSLVLETPLSALQQRYVRTIANAGERLVALLNDVLDLARLEEGKLELDAQPFAPAAAINEIADSVTARAMEKGLVLQVETDVPTLLVLSGDGTRLRQVVNNLLGNAIKFTDRGAVTLRAHWQTRRDTPPSGTLHVEVADTGVGIPADRIEHIFALFSSVHLSTSRRRGASGAGLAIARQLVELMGGKLGVESTVGRGSRFFFSIPGRVATEAMPPEVTQLEFGPTAADAPAILVLDPQALSREIMTTVLARNGYRVDGAATVADALGLLQRGRYAALFMDLDDAEADTGAVARELRTAIGGGHPTPIIAVASTLPKDGREGSATAEVNEYLTRPVYMPAVLAALQAFVRPAESATTR